MAIKNKLPIWDERMLYLIDHVIKNKIKGIDSAEKIITALKMPQRSIFNQVRNKKQSFRHEHFYKACELFDVPMDWFYGFTDKMKKNTKDQTVEELLQLALVQIRSKKKG